MTDLVLIPAACYPVYPAIAARGPLAAGRRHRRRRRRLRLPARAVAAIRRGCRCSTSARSSGSASPTTVAAWRDAWRDRAVALLRGLGLDADFDVAADPFFGRSGRMLAASQREQALKFEIAGPDRRRRSRRRSPRSTTTRTTSRRRSASSSPTAAWRTPAASASGSSGSRSRCCAPTASTRRRWPDDGARGALAAMSAATAGMVSLFGLDPATYVPHAVHAGRPDVPRDQLLHRHPHRAAPRARRRAAGGDGFTGPDRLRGRPVDVLQAAARRPRGALRDRHPRDAAVPAAAGPDRRAARRRPDDDRRARRLVPAGHGGDELPHRARQDVGRSPRRSTVDGERLRYFHNAGAVRARGRGLPRRLPPRRAPFRRRPAALHRARPLRRRPAARAATELRAARASCSRGHLAAAPADNPFDRFGARLAADLPGLLDGRRGRATTPTPSRPSGWPAPASSLLASHVDWLLGERGARPRRPRWTRIVEGCKVLCFKLARRRQFDPQPYAAARGGGWDEAMTALDGRRLSHGPARREARRGSRDTSASSTRGWQGRRRNAGAHAARRRSTASTGCRRGCRGRRPGRSPRPAGRPRRARPRRRGLVVSDRLRRRAGGRRRGGRRCASTASRRSPTPA